MRYWVYLREWSAESRTYGAFIRQDDPTFICLGPEEAERVDPRAAVIARVRADWKSWDLPRARVVTQPDDETLVNVATRFRTTTPPPATLPPKPVLGMPVTLSIRATGYVWDFGDGTRLRAEPRDGRPRSEHTYREPGVYEARLRTYYSATFTIAGSPTVYRLEGTADVPGRATEIVAREARSELVAD